MSGTSRFGVQGGNVRDWKAGGFSVPEGVVRDGQMRYEVELLVDGLTTEALADALVAAGLHNSARQAAIEAMSLPNNFTHALATAVARLGSKRLAVRSSIVDESRGPECIGRTW